LFGDGALQGTQDGGQRVGLWFGHEEVNVFGHDDVAEEVKLIFPAGGFEGVLEDGGGAGGGQVGISVVAAEGDEVEIACLLSSFEAWGHGVLRLSPR
jgi:hypothetical protein